MSYVYVARGQGAVKIGVALNPEARISSLQTGSPHSLKLVAQLPGDRALEADLHSRFSAHRIRGEWFKISPEIRAFIAEHRLPRPKRLASPAEPKALPPFDYQSRPADKRRSLGLTQAALAGLLGVKQSTVSRNETAAEPDRRYVLALEALAVRKGLGL